MALEEASDSEQVIFIPRGHLAMSKTLMVIVSRWQG